jgi:hypothetical protein
MTMMSVVIVRVEVNISFTEDSSLLGCDAVSLGAWFPVFQIVLIFNVQAAQNASLFFNPSR